MYVRVYFLLDNKIVYVFFYHRSLHTFSVEFNNSTPQVFTKKKKIYTEENYTEDTKSTMSSGGDGNSTGSNDSVIKSMRHMNCKLAGRKRLMGHSSRIFDTCFSPT